MADETPAEELARRIISHHFGDDPFHIKAEGGGLNNKVLSVQHRAGDFIVRIRPKDSDPGTFLKEKWATAKAREAGVPAPEILEVGREAIPNAYMIARKSAGESATSHGERLQIVREMGRYAAIINSIETHGFGATFDWADEHRPRTWQEFFKNEWKLEQKLEILESNGMVSAVRRRKLRDLVEGAGAECLSQRLNHGDLRLKNLLVEKDGRISAILDWEHCTSNITPQWELSLALHDLNIDEKQAFLSAYGLSPEKTQAIAPVLKAINIVNYAKHVEKLVREKNEERLAEYRIRLNGTLDLYCL